MMVVVLLLLRTVGTYLLRHAVIELLCCEILHACTLHPSCLLLRLDSSTQTRLGSANQEVLLYVAFRVHVSSFPALIFGFAAKKTRQQKNRTTGAQM